jgi:hypothetical protein
MKKEERLWVTKRTEEMAIGAGQAYIVLAQPALFLTFTFCL